MKKQCKKEFSRKRINGKLDRISELPDHLLGYILSLLSIEEAVKTSVLSSRWKNLWNLVTNIEFHYMTEAGLKKYEDFIDHVLRSCKSTNLEKFRLQCSEVEDMSRINGWISCAVSRNPKKLVLEMDFKILDYCVPVAVPPYPECILSYNTMVILKLKSCFELKIPDSVVSFPCLKTLHFNGWYPYHSDVVDRLMSSSPVLEELHIEGFLEPDVVLLFDISVPTLKELHIEFRSEATEFCRHYVLIDTPKLEDLDIKDDSHAQYFVKKLDSIISVSVDYDNIEGEDSDLEHIKRLLVLLQGTSETKHLSLSSNTIDILEKSVLYVWPIFHHLTSLTLWAEISLHSWTLLVYLLKNSPKLECLKLYKDHWGHRKYEQENQYVWNPPKSIIPDCLKQTLKFVQFNSFMGRSDEFQVVEYLLNYAKVLEAMVIITDPYPLKDEIQEKLEMFETASEACEIFLYEKARWKISSEALEKFFD